MLDARPGDPHGIGFLKSILADVVCGHLAGDDDHRNRIHIGRGNPRHRIGHARARSHQADTRSLRRARISIRRMDRRLFVTDKNVLDLVLLEQLIIKKQNRAARIAEDIIDFFFLQALHYNFCTRQEHLDSQNSIIRKTRHITG